jgi:putative oligomerization/nucleic acid binding protein
VPLVLYAARALPTMKRGYSLIRKWNSLPAEQRAAVQEQGRRAVVAIMAVKVAATAERSSGDPPASWEAALERVLHPGPAEEMAKAVVVHLQKVSEATAEGIAAAVGAAGKDDSTLKRAMSMARDDGYIRRVGVTFHGIKWDTTEWADLQLLDTPHVRRLEDEIVAFVKDFGLVSLDHISGEIGVENDAPEFRAALERAIADESVGWYCNGIYGISQGQLEGFEPKHDLWAETKPVTQDKDFGGALEELESAVKGLARAMGAKGGDSAIPVDDGADGQDGNPYDGLRRVQELHDAGVLSAEEFAAKKAELLKRI